MTLIPAGFPPYPGGILPLVLHIMRKREVNVERLFAVELEQVGAKPRFVFVRASTIEAAILEAGQGQFAVLSVRFARERAPGEFVLGQEVPHAVAA